MIRLCLVLVFVSLGMPVRADSRARAVRRTGPITVDGHLTEAAWETAPKQQDFTQRFPKDGVKAQLETSFAILYDDQAIYVGVWADDPEPHRIRRLLTRRDVDSPGDAIVVGIDSYHDKRTAYVFQLNAAGVQRDMMLSDDSKEDWTWDAVWTGDVSTTDKGWCAEFRIPLNQLRFPTRDTHEWGFQVLRVVSRTQEQATWSPWPRSGSEVVSKFGVVEGIEKLKPARRLELLPYASGGVQSLAVDALDPLNDQVSAAGSVGLDLKYGLGPAFTLSATINPDFGQVEADPSQVNLSGNELFFEEKRPFFVEGADLFKLPLSSTNGGIETQFYSRRIGAAPTALPDSYTFIDSPATITIYNAAKLSGKTAGGWSVGVLDAVTAEEHATIIGDDGVTRSKPIVSPLTNYMIGRVKRDFREGKTSVGASTTAVARQLDGTGLEDQFHDQAYTAGLQADHRWGAKGAWQATMNLITSYVHGTEGAIANTQTSQVHLFQNPDTGNASFDPMRTSLGGFGAGWVIGRMGNTKHWRFGSGGDLRSPGLELNDAGFQRESNQLITFHFVEYHEEEPGDDVLNWSINTDVFTGATLEPQFTALGLESNGHVQFSNYWNINFGTNIIADRLSPGLLRGGPTVHTPDPFARANVFINTDNRKPVQIGFGFYGGATPNTGSNDGGFNLGVTVQARSNIDVFVGPSWSHRNDAMQFVDEAADENGMSHYVFARINQQTAAMTARMNWTFSPKLSLQAYAQPFVSTGRYSQYKDITRPHADRFEDRFDVLERGNLTFADGTFTATNGGTYTFGKPDFSFAQIRSNLVVRWEYRPGSTVFAIWSHGQTNEVADDGRFRLGRNLGDLTDTRGEDLVMVKANYWIGL